MCLFCMLMSAAMYYPFLKAYERSLLKKQQEELQRDAQLALNS
jgi:PTS system cellobiose-specific IIC component